MVGVNVSHDEVLQYTSGQFTLKEGLGDKMKSSLYLGGEARQRAPVQHAHVAIVGKGAALNQLKVSDAFMALLHVMTHNRKEISKP